MRDGGRLTAAIEVLTEIETRHKPVRLAMKNWGEGARYAGSKDRAFISGLVLDVLRRRRSLGWRMGDDSIRAAVLATLHLHWGWPLDRLADAAGDEVHGHGPLTDAERQALAAPRDLADAPPPVRGDYPDWLEPSFIRAFGDDRGAETAALSERAPVDLRVNTIKTDPVRALKALTTSPLVGREEAVRAVAATAAAMKLDPITGNFLGVLARNRRLAQLPAIIRAFNILSARHRGEVTAEVTSAHSLDDDQVDALKQNLRTRMGRDITVDLNVDPAILGGLVVKIGSQMIDGSIRTKLNTLATAMKG